MRLLIDCFLSSLRQVLKIQMRPYFSDIDNLNQYMNELRSTSPDTVDVLSAQVEQINERWKVVLEEFVDREVCKDGCAKSSLCGYVMVVGCGGHLVDNVMVVIWLITWWWPSVW